VASEVSQESFSTVHLAIQAFPRAGMFSSAAKDSVMDKVHSIMAVAFSSLSAVLFNLRHKSFQSLPLIPGICKVD